MKKQIGWKAFSVFTAAMVLLSACAGAPKASVQSMPESSSSMSQAAAVYTRITPEQAKERMEANPDAIVLDVRTASEYEENHIPGAMLLPNEEIGTEMPAQLPDLNAEILVYCRSGNRSRQASEKLIAMGYTQVFDFGGIGDWKYETESDAYDASQMAAKTLADVEPVEWQEKTIVGCRNDLPYPLQMSGTSSAQSFGDAWTATDIAGNTVSNEILKEKPLTLLAAWGTFCVSCIQDLENLQTLQDKFGEQGLQVLGVVASAQSRDGSEKDGERELASQVMEMAQASFTQVLPSDDLIQIRLSELDIIPAYYFVDSDGEVVGEPLVGYQTYDELETAVTQRLGK